MLSPPLSTGARSLCYSPGLYIASCGQDLESMIPAQREWIFPRKDGVPGAPATPVARQADLGSSSGTCLFAGDLSMSGNPLSFLFLVFRVGVRRSFLHSTTWRSSEV